MLTSASHIPKICLFQVRDPHPIPISQTVSCPWSSRFILSGPFALFLSLPDPEAWDPRMRVAWPWAMEGGWWAQIAWVSIPCPTQQWAEALTTSARDSQAGGRNRQSSNESRLQAGPGPVHRHPALPSSTGEPLCPGNEEGIVKEVALELMPQ